MDYLTKLLEVINPFYWWSSSLSTPAEGQPEPSESSDKHEIPVTNPGQALVLVVQEGSDPVNPNAAHPQIAPLDLPNPPTYPDEIVTVDKINVIVKYAGESIEVEVFPLESISVLLHEACEKAKKKPEKMHLVYEGEYLDVNKKVNHYGLRGGNIVRLIPI